MSLNNVHITIVGLGYVGLPLAIEFGKKYPTIGFDINSKRIKELEEKLDRTKELTSDEINQATYLSFTNAIDTSDLPDNKRRVFIVTVPTPIDQFKTPDLGPLISASKTIGTLIRKDDIVVYESTVFPGCTEEVCVPVLEKYSQLKYNIDFYCGYSPERINPGDKLNTLTSILKITSGSNKEVSEYIDSLYGSIINAGTYKASSIRVAEAAKLIENCQRDVNISFVNELALIFDRMGIDTNEVLEAAGTKWNFLKFKPGLVGGHCIGVDPYYMIHKAEQLGYYPEVIGAGRRINDNMGVFVANKLIKLMINNGLPVKNSKALIMGFTFKENCPDIRNTRVIDIYKELISFGINTDIYDPWASIEEVEHEYELTLIQKIENEYDAIILAVAHQEFLSFDLPKHAQSVVFDIKGVLSREVTDYRL